MTHYTWWWLPQRRRAHPTRHHSGETWSKKCGETDWKTLSNQGNGSDRLGRRRRFWSEAVLGLDDPTVCRVGTRRKKKAKGESAELAGWKKAAAAKAIVNTGNRDEDYKCHEGGTP